MTRRARLRYRLRAILAGLTMRPISGAEDPPAADPPAADPPAPTEPKLLNEEQVNKIVQERLARDRRERPSDEEIVALREAQTKLDEIEQANKTELEQAQQRAEAAEAKAQEASDRANKVLRKAAVISAAAKENADPDIVHALLADQGFKVKHEDTEIEVTVGEDGQVVNAVDAVKALVAEKNLSSEPAPPPPGDGGARAPVQPKDLDEQIAEAEAAGDITRSVSLKSAKLLASQEAGTA